MPARPAILPLENVEKLVYFVRGQKVMLDSDLAALYGVKTKVLNQAVKRNRERFPEDFMFQLSEEEMGLVMETRASNWSQFVTSSKKKYKILNKNCGSRSDNWSQFVTSSQTRRGSSYRFFAFTEQGVAMLSSVLQSPRAVQVNIEIMRAFIRLRQWLASNGELSSKLNDLEKKYDEQFKVVFEAIRELMTEKTDTEPAREIGFHTLRERVKEYKTHSKRFSVKK